jgi:putative phosphoribosyl transferase
VPACTDRKKEGDVTFSNRVAAGRRLATELAHLRGSDVVVLGLPRGGVPVAFEVARALDAPLDVIVVRKVGVPWQLELAMGAVGEDGVTIANDEVVGMAAVTGEEWAAAAATARAELDRRVAILRGGRPRVELSGKTAIIVDDGIATGATAYAACQVARAHGADRVVLAVPVASPRAVKAMSAVADEVVCVQQPGDFVAVGQFYDDFTPTTDREVMDLLDRAAATQRDDPETPAVADDPPGVDEEVTVNAGGATLAGHLTMPPDAAEVVVFAHAGASSRHNPRNRQVARMLQQAGLGTLLFDLLTPDEESDRGKVFDIELLAGRLRDVIGWLRQRPATAGLPVGLYGAGTGSAAALSVAAGTSANVAAVVCRSGRPDLVGPRLCQVRAATLFIVGGLDGTALTLACAAQESMCCPAEIAVVPGATHLFDEPGNLHAAAEHATGWFNHHIPTRQRG